MWLGILKHKKYFIQGLPKGYEVSNELRNVDRPRALPPAVIHYAQKHVRIPARKDRDSRTKIVSVRRKLKTQSKYR